MFCDEDIKFKNNWENFHKEKAELQILCEKCNLKKRNSI